MINATTAAPIITGTKDTMPSVAPMVKIHAEKVLPSFVNIIHQMTAAITPIENKIFKIVHIAIAVIIPFDYLLIKSKG